MTRQQGWSAQCRGCRTVNPDEAQYCIACAAPLAADSGNVGLRTVSVVFVDLARSTELAGQFSTEAWSGLLTRYFALVGECLAAHGGRVEKFIGDAVVAVFGVDSASQEDAHSAVLAARAAVAAVDREASRMVGGRGVSLSIRLGVASGRVAVSEHRNSSFAIGRTLNRAARLQATATDGEVAVDLRTWLLVRDRFETTRLPDVRAKGFTEPLSAWRVGEESPPRRPDSSPFVDRADLTETFREMVRAGVTGGCSVVIEIIGEAGIGKSRLVEHVLTEFATEAACLVLPTTTTEQESYALWPLYQMLASLAPLGGEPDPVSGGGTSSVQTRVELHWRIRQLLTETARHRPLLLVLENRERFAHPLAALVDDLAAAPVDAALVLITTGRGPDQSRAPDNPSRSLRVGPLPHEHAYALFGALAGDVSAHTVGDRTGELVQLSGGNPLYLEQIALLMKEVVEDGDLIPPTAEAVIGERLDRLAAGDRLLIARLAALGQEFPAVALDMIEGATGPGLERLLDVGLLAFGEQTGVLRFAAPAVAEVAYRRLGARDRAAIHTRIAQETRGRLDAEPAAVEILAAHADRAHRAWQEIDPMAAEAVRAAQAAAQAFVGAARFAAAGCELQAATDFLARARLLCPAGGDGAEVASVEAYVALSRGDPAEAIRLGEEAAGRAGERGRYGAAAHLFLTTAIARMVRDGAVDLAALRRGSAMAQRSGDPGALARASLVAGLAHTDRGDYASADRAFTEAVARVRGTPVSYGVAEIYGNHALTLAYSDRPAGEALVTVTDVYREVAATPVLRAAVGCPLALLRHMTDDAGAAWEVLAESEQLLRQLDHVAGLASLAEFEAVLRLRDGDVAGVLAALGSAVRGFQAVGLTADAQRVRLKADLIAGRIGPGTPPPGPTDPRDWRMSSLGLLHRAVREAGAGDRESAARALFRAARVIKGIAGAGAVIEPLLTVVRVAGGLLDADLVQDVRRQLADAAQVKGDRLVARSLAGPPPVARNGSEGGK
ncbi:AAA family ATPase [Micromonospora sp. Llam7]|uniref:adenylate/guanylate cyclase domain-containing protein n=1 Tax=Micromonospora tarapacensis TaxID=2835305 RepID=UPI001C82D433|nr:AAA family ATPase [Micromonospora tarapacensis]